MDFYIPHRTPASRVEGWIKKITLKYLFLDELDHLEHNIMSTNNFFEPIPIRECFHNTWICCGGGVVLVCWLGGMYYIQIQISKLIIF